MKAYKKVNRAVEAYRSCPEQVLGTLRFYYQVNPKNEDTSSEEFARREEESFRMAGDYIIRDDNDNIIVEESIAYAKEHLDGLFYYAHCTSFVRTMNRMKLLKEELMMVTWHPSRIERILELGGFEALDNFAGL
jgi:hypothetical protein